MNNYLSALMDQLDPNKPKTQDGDAIPMDPSTVPIGNDMPQAPQVVPTKIEDTATGASAPVGAAAAATAPTWAKGANAGKPVTLLGFDSAKLSDPNYSSEKYSPSAKAFGQSIGQDVGWTRGSDNANAINYLKANGFGNAKMVGDDKVDFGDGRGPEDIFGSDGSLRFQNTYDNPQWEAANAGAAAAHKSGADMGGGGAPMVGSGHGNPMVQGDALGNVNAALAQLGQPSNMLQQLIAQLSGGGA